MSDNRRNLAAGLAAVAMLAGADRVLAQKPNSSRASASVADNYDEQFARYLREARTQAARSADAWAWMTSLALDPRARRVNDVVTIQVVESITASGTADSALDKSSAAALGVPNLFGLEKKLPSSVDPANLVGIKGDNNFKGSGSTNRTGALTANLTARVSEVLPNGDLVLEGVREIEINGDRQIVVLSGVVRVTDIAPNNVVPSTSVAQLRIRYFGRGLMKDNLQPGWLVRALNKIF
ncbi:MAG TPA: flagellar basal body L-ring protein FlgH [Vicinamibacterales bacterium]|nr:flagellar basal body L-ring protein FlgH [Vicinamibacterales bacterium]